VFAVWSPEQEDAEHVHGILFWVGTPSIFEAQRESRL
jgi:hypothetical protein